MVRALSDSLYGLSKIAIAQVLTFIQHLSLPDKNLVSFMTS